MTSINNSSATKFLTLFCIPALILASGSFDISNSIDLDSLRLQKIHEHIEPLVPEDENVTPPKFDSSSFQEPEYDLLSEIINQVNNTYGVNLTEEDRLDLSRLSKRLIEDNEIEKYMKGENTEDNKQNFFKEQFEIRMIDYVKERFDFYKKMDENREMKNFIFDIIYKDYQKQVVQK